MIQQRAHAEGLDQLVSARDFMADGLPYFAVWYNKQDKWFQCTIEDFDAATDFLINNLRIAADSGDNSLYYLKIYPVSDKNYKRSGEVGSIPFRLNPQTEGGNAVGAYGGGGANLDSFAKMLKEMNEKNMALALEIAELKNANNQNIDWFDRIGGLLETPGAAQMIGGIIQPFAGLLAGFLGKVSGAGFAGMPQPNYAHNPVIAGIQPNMEEFDVKVDQALDRLEKHCDLSETLTALADFADKNPEKFKMYLLMLKS